MSASLGEFRAAVAIQASDDRRMIKCVVWDLDNTLWQGTLLEDCSVYVNDQVVEIIRTLDGRGILQSIASKNDHDHAMGRLRTPA